MKSYSKPEIMFDCFELAENIAACAVLDTNEHARYSCPVTIPDLNLTIFANDECNILPADGPQICYEVPMEGFNVFVS